MTVFEMIQKEEEYKTFTRLFLITDPLIYIITPPPNSSWERHTVLEDLACFPLLWLSKATLLFSPNSVSVFFIWLGWAEKAKIFDSIIGDKESVLPFWVEVYNAHY